MLKSSVFLFIDSKERFPRTTLFPLFSIYIFLPMLVFKCIFLKNNFLLFTCMTIHNMFFLIMIVASCTNYVKCSMCEKHKLLKKISC